MELKEIKKNRIIPVFTEDANDIYLQVSNALGNDTPLAQTLVTDDTIVWLAEGQWKNMAEATPDEQLNILDVLVNVRMLVAPVVDEAVLDKLFTYPDDDFIFFSNIDGNIKIMLTGWGYRINQDASVEENEPIEAIVPAVEDTPIEKEVPIEVSTDENDNTVEEAPTAIDVPMSVPTIETAAVDIDPSQQPPSHAVDNNEQAIRFCPNCGNEISADMTFCTSCGNKLELSGNTSSSSNDNDLDDGLESDDKKDKLFKFVITTFAVLLIVCIVIWSYIFIFLR